MKYKVTTPDECYVFDTEVKTEELDLILDEFANQSNWVNEFASESIDSIDEKDNRDEIWAEFDALYIKKKNEFYNTLISKGRVSFTNQGYVEYVKSCKVKQIEEYKNASTTEYEWSIERIDDE
ncbi:MAG: hypothetical protein VZS44_10115 [Bacilli bacterium]|nr:hypothetical protein [Bacilli bacterium]